VLHFGLRVGDTYVDPMTLFRPVDLAKVVHLAPADDPAESAWTPARERAEIATSLRLPLPATAALPGATPSDGGCGGAVAVVGGAISALCDVGEWLGVRVDDALHAGVEYLRVVSGISDGVARRLERAPEATATFLRAVPPALARAVAATPTGMLALDLVAI